MRGMVLVLAMCVAVGAGGLAAAADNATSTTDNATPTTASPSSDDLGSYREVGVGELVGVGRSGDTFEDTDGLFEVRSREIDFVVASDDPMDSFSFVVDSDDLSSGAAFGINSSVWETESCDSNPLGVSGCGIVSIYDDGTCRLITDDTVEACPNSFGGPLIVPFEKEPRG